MFLDKWKKLNHKYKGIAILVLTFDVRIIKTYTDIRKNSLERFLIKWCEQFYQVPTKVMYQDKRFNTSRQ